MRTPWEPVRAGLGVGLLLMLVFCNIAISAEGALRFYPPEIDFGARLTGEKVLVSTSVLNVSSDDVLIKMIKSSCHCTALKSGDMYVPSGKRLDLIFEIDGVGVNGVLENKIWILTEKPQPEVYTITVRGTFASLTNHLFANKKKLYLGVSQYRRFVRYMTLQRQGAAHLGSLTFQPSQPWIKADIVESNVTMARLRITLDVPPAITSFHEEVAAYGCDPNDFVRIPIMGEVRPAIYPSRSIIYVDAEKSYEVCFEFYNGRAKTLTKHEFIGDGLDVFEIIDHLNIDNRPSLMVGIKKLTTEQPVLTGELLLFFEGEALPVEVKFISANANAPGNN